MKKFIIFAISFILLFGLFQLLSGLVLTYVYTPDMEEAWKMSVASPEETVISSSGGSFLMSLLIPFAAAAIAYVISNATGAKTSTSK